MRHTIPGHPAVQGQYGLSNLRAREPDIFHMSMIYNVENDGQELEFPSRACNYPYLLKIRDAYLELGERGGYMKHYVPLVPEGEARVTRWPVHGFEFFITEVE